MHFKILWQLVLPILLFRRAEMQIVKRTPKDFYPDNISTNHSYRTGKQATGQAVESYLLFTRDLDLSMVCVSRWVFKLKARLNFFKQNSHWKDFSPVCVNWCLLKALVWLNSLKQVSHVKVFSPVCIIRCLFKTQAWLNFFKQVSHEKVFYPVCVI